MKRKTTAKEEEKVAFDPTECCLLSDMKCVETGTLIDFTSEKRLALAPDLIIISECGKKHYTSKKLITKAVSEVYRRAVETEAQNEIDAKEPSYSIQLLLHFALTGQKHFMRAANLDQLIKFGEYLFKIDSELLNEMVPNFIRYLSVLPSAREKRSPS